MNLNDLKNLFGLHEKSFVPNVGIGTASPSTTLEVEGIIHSTNGGIMFPDGTVQSTASTSTATPWIAAGSNIYSANSGNVGIGTSTPASMLTIAPPGGTSGKTQAFTTSGSWTVPSGLGVTSITVEVWGGGGGGGGANANTYAGGGGAGGAYAKKTIAVTDGQTFTISVGYGGAGGVGAAAGLPGTASWVGSTATVCAAGGLGGAYGSNGAGGAGSTNGCTTNGTITYNGGAGGNGVNGTKSGAGGGGAGDAGAGGSASGGTPGAGGAANGGGGGAGVGNSANSAGNPGNSLGGGGAGGYRVSGSSQNGGAGASGMVKISWVETGMNVAPLQVLNPLGGTALIVTNDGMVGIGTTSPSASLSVNGGIRVAKDTSDTLTSCDSTNAGKVSYVGGIFYGCNGYKWNAFSMTMVTDVQTSRGFFVATKSNYNGVLGGLSGANSLCFNELITQSWKGKDDAAFRGMLTPAHVFAFLCDASTCQSPLPNVTYQLATAGYPFSGGGTFTTDGSGNGPNNATDWAASGICGDDGYGNCIGGIYYWTGRAAGTATVWSTSPHTSTCTSWSSTAGNTRAGFSQSTASARWSYATAQACNTYKRLLCVVNP